MFAHGVARAGYIQAPRDPTLAYQFLRVEWRTVQHDGVVIGKRTYRGDVLGWGYVGSQSPYAERGGLWPFHIDPDDITRIYFYDLNHSKQWYPLIWTQAPRWNGPLNEDGLAFARKIAASKYRHFDDQLALAELLERRKLSQGATMAERRTALRVSREQSTLATDARGAVGIDDLPTVRRLRTLPESEDVVFVDDLDEISESTESSPQIRGGTDLLEDT